MAQHKNIDIVPDETITRVHLSQGDIGRTLIFYLFENALSWSVPASSTIKCQGTKPSGFGFSVSCTYSGNAVTCVTTEGMTDEYGQIEAELLITSSDESQVFGTSNFILDIERNPHPDSTEDGGADTAISLTARVTALESNLGDLDDLQTPVKTSIVDAINSLTVGSGLTDDIKQALLQLASKVAYIDDDGQDYYDALEDALYPPVELASITCVYTQSGTVYPTTSLDSLKSDLVVTATYSDSSTATLSSSDYTLSGTLTEGTSTITVTYGGKTTTFTVTVTAAPIDTTAQIDTDHMNKGQSNTYGNYSNKTGFCPTIKYSINSSLTSGYDYIRGIIPVDETSSSTCRVWFYDANDANVDISSGYGSGKPINVYAESMTEGSFTVTLSLNPASFTIPVHVDYLDKAYLYLGSTGEVLFAGTNTPYYGMSNISEASS